MKFSTLDQSNLAILKIMHIQFNNLINLNQISFSELAQMLSNFKNVINFVELIFFKKKFNSHIF